MRKSRYITLLLAGAAATALAACDQNVMTGPGSDAAKDGTIYSDAASCAQDQDAAACTAAFEAARTEHVEKAPKFANKAECEAAGFSPCEEAPVKNADGSSSTSMFMPMMMGYLMGRTLGGGAQGFGAPPPQGGGPYAKQTPTTKPVYSDRNGYLYAGRDTVGRVAPGSTSLGSSSMPTRTVARSGFGNTGFAGGGS